MDLMKQYKGLSSHYPVLNELNRASVESNGRSVAWWPCPAFTYAPR